MKQTAREFTTFALWLLLLGAPASLSAHKVRVFATGDGDRIEGYAYFPGGVRARNCSVTLFTMDGTKVGQTQTDAKGTFSFSAHQHCDHKVVLDAGDGHHAEFVVSADELGPAVGEPVRSAAETHTGKKSSPESGAPNPGAQSQSAEFARIVDRILARRLRPFEERLDRYEAKVYWHDVAGGIGYILGLAGLFVLLTSRQGKHRA